MGAGGQPADGGGLYGATVEAATPLQGHIWGSYQGRCEAGANMQLDKRYVNSVSALACLMMAGGAGACATQAPQPVSDVRAGLQCVDDSLACRSQREMALNALLADKSRAWVGQSADAAAYASGVRLFAFKKRKRDLDCNELGIGQREAKAARPTLRAASASLTPAQIARGAMLGDEVDIELARERQRRGCRT